MNEKDKRRLEKIHNESNYFFDSIDIAEKKPELMMIMFDMLHDLVLSLQYSLIDKKILTMDDLNKALNKAHREKEEKQNFIKKLEEGI
ncbi:hypothetical protein A3K72_01865 [Candidatus Woesearchaeota archaeon RBG_13_36_6]|nr:MAG: hypothetical protein A3K72_01865 [Candidatus Woesearchaeota archaeon RBG_13_36_6]